jgi:hypothetical protein
LTDTVKGFFREVGEPFLVFPFKERTEYSSKYSILTGIASIEDRVEILHQMIKKLSRHKYLLLKILMIHLSKYKYFNRVAKEAAINKMTVMNLSMIFSGVLFDEELNTNTKWFAKAGEAEAKELARMEFLKRDLVIEDLINHHEVVFELVDHDKQLSVLKGKSVSENRLDSHKQTLLKNSVSEEILLEDEKDGCHIKSIPGHDKQLAELELLADKERSVGDVRYDISENWGSLIVYPISQSDISQNLSTKIDKKETKTEDPLPPSESKKIGREDSEEGLDTTSSLMDLVNLTYSYGSLKTWNGPHDRKRSLVYFLSGILFGMFMYTLFIQPQTSSEFNFGISPQEFHSGFDKYSKFKIKSEEPKESQDQLGGLVGLAVREENMENKLN